MIQMAMGGWVARAISEISRLGIPDRVKQDGPMTAAELAADGVTLRPKLFSV